MRISVLVTARAAVLALPLSLAALSSGCSNGNGGGYVPTDDAGTTDDLAQAPDAAVGYPAPYPTGPQVVNDNGGPVLASPVFVPVFFANFDAAKKAPVKDFLTKVGATNFWAATTAEYGVGPGKMGAAVELVETANGTIDANSIPVWLAAKLNAKDKAFPTPTANTIYVLFYPTAVTITMQGGFGGTNSSCTEFGGYHEDVVINGGLDVAFAVIPDCGTFGNLDGIDDITATTSHELIEAATDPSPLHDPAFQSTDPDHIYWSFVLGGGEVGDLCAQDPTSFVKLDELPAYTIQRSWSNMAAAAGHDPCVPAPAGEVYFAAVPELPDTVDLFGGRYSSPGVTIATGDTKTVTIDLFSDAPTGGPWTVFVHDAGPLLSLPGTLKITLDKSSGQNGDKLVATINRIADSQLGASPFYLESRKNGVSHMWFGLVGQ